MAFFHSPTVVTRNLRVCVDGRNNLSYPGSGTTWFKVNGNGLDFSNGSFAADPNGGYYLSSNGNVVETPTTDALNTDFHTIMLILRFTGNGTYPEGVTGGWEQFIGYYGGGTDRSPGIWDILQTEGYTGLIILEIHQLILELQVWIQIFR